MKALPPHEPIDLPMCWLCRDCGLFIPSGAANYIAHQEKYHTHKIMLDAAFTFAKFFQQIDYLNKNK